LSVGTQLRTVLHTTPKRYQVQGVRAIEAAGGRFVLGDDMGLGKTLEAIGWLAIHPEIKRVVVVCPAQVKYHWQNQMSTHAGLQAGVAEGQKPYKVGCHIVVINYTILAHALWPNGKRTKRAKPKAFPWVDHLRLGQPQLVIIDECHCIKERSALRTMAVQQLCRGIPYVIAASGTPIDAAPVEFFTTLNIVAPREFSSFWRYVQQYCNPKKAFRGRGWDFSGHDNLEELHERIQPFMIRRMKSEVAKELPPKIRTILPIRLSNQREYRRAENNYLDWVEENQGQDAAKRASAAIGLTKMGALKRVAAEGKLKSFKNWAEDFLATGEKLIVFCIHRRILAEIKKLFPTCASIAGGTRNRQAEVERFQNDPSCRVFAGQIKASGEGLDGLQDAASTVVFLELWYRWSKHEQAEDRALRIGQDASIVNVFYMIAKDTIEEGTLDLLQSNYDIRQKVLDGDFCPVELFKHRGKQNGFKETA